MGLGTVGSELDHRLIAHHGLVEPAPCLQDGAQIDASRDEIGPQRQRSLEARGRLVEPSSIAQRGAEVVVELRHPGPGGDGGLEQGDRQVEPAGLMRDHPEEMESIRVTRMHREDLAVQGLGLTCSAGLMVLDGRGELGLKGYCADRLECDRCGSGLAPAVRPPCLQGRNRATG